GAGMRQVSGPLLQLGKSKGALIHFVIVTDQQFGADTKRWSPQVAGRTEHVIDQGLIVWPPLDQVKRHDLLAFGHNELANAIEQLESVFGSDSIFGGIDGFGD